MTNPIVFAYSFDLDGKATKLNSKRVAQELENEGLSWVHLDANSANTAQWLQQKVGYLDHLIIDALIAEETRPRVMEFESGLLIILRGINLNKNSEPEDMISIRIWVDADRIITLQRRELQSLFDVQKQIEGGKTIKNSAEFVYSLIYQTLFSTSPFLYGLGEKVDDLEEKIMNTHDAMFREEILQIRTSLTTFKRYLVPQREAIAKLKICDQKWINSWAKRHFQENLDQITMMIEEVDETRDRAQILHDEIFHGLSEKLNRSMYILSLVSSVFIPLTFFTSIFSVNIGGLPGLDKESAFWLMMVSMFFMAAAQVLLFKRKKLF
jgi:zinc transporter